MSASDIIAVAGLVVAVAGIPTTFLLARRTHRRPELRYAMDFDVILRADDRLFDRGLYMTLGDHQLNSISRTRIAFWNNRGDPIRSSDVVNGDPLRLQLNEKDEVLQARVLATSRMTTGVAAEPGLDQNSILIDFDFLDAWDGAVLEVIHKTTHRPTVQGIIQGCDLHNGGSARLSPDALKAVAEKHLWRRFWMYGKSSRAQRMILLNMSMPIVCVIALAITVFLVPSYQPNHLINIHKYQLSTISGQVEFATAVSNLQAFNGGLTRLNYIVFAITSLAAATGIALIVYRIVRRAIPSSIVANNFTLDEADKSEVIKSDDAVQQPD